jgi:hypothetical protein
MKTRSVVIQICEIHQKTIWPRPYRRYAFSFPCKSARAHFITPERAFGSSSCVILGIVCSKRPTPMRALSHSVREKFFLFSKNNPIKLFPGGIALLISTHTLHQTSGARDEVVLINSLAAQSEMHFLVQITECKCIVRAKSCLESFQKQPAKNIKKL